MNEKYVCGLCGRTHTDLDEYINCVTRCGNKLKEIEKEEKEKKRLEELNAALNGVKQAKIYYEQKLNEFKEKYPEEYDLNFATESCTCSSNCKDFNEEKDNKTERLEVKVITDSDGKPKIDAKINGKKIDDKTLKDLSIDPEINFLARMFGLI